jgi:hypothetical protein
MKRKVKVPTGLQARTSEELRLLYARNPTPEMRVALWEIWRLKQRIWQFHEDFVILQRCWPRNPDGWPIGLEMLRRSMRREMDETCPPIEGDVPVAPNDTP